MINRIKTVVQGKSFTQSTLYISYYFWRKFINIFYSSFAKIYIILWGGNVGKNFKVGGRLRIHSGGKIVIGDNVRIVSGSQNYVGGNCKTSIWTGTNGEFIIENGCGISNTTFVCFGKIKILENTYIGGGCEIYDTDFHPINSKGRMNMQDIPIGKITVGPSAFVGGFSIILKNVNIGEGAVIGAGSLVVNDVPPFEVWGGVPAKFIKKLAPSSL